MRPRSALAAIAFVLSPAVVAADPGDAEALADALRIEETVQILREEGIADGRILARDLFPEAMGPGWTEILEDIYDTGLPERVSAAFVAALAPTREDLEPLVAFFTSDTGQRILDLELEARRAISDPEVEAAAAEVVGDLRSHDDPIIGLVEAYIAANDLVEQNTVGAMNASMAFFLGMSEGGFGASMAEDEVLADVYGRMPEIRAETEDWLMAYLTLAYRPVPQDALEEYIALSGSPSGQALNGAIFVVFDRIYVDLSRELGRRAAAYMTSEDL